MEVTQVGITYAQGTQVSLFEGYYSQSTQLPHKIVKVISCFTFGVVLPTGYVRAYE